MVVVNDDGDGYGMVWYDMVCIPREGRVCGCVEYVDKNVNCSNVEEKLRFHKVKLPRRSTSSFDKTLFQGVVAVWSKRMDSTPQEGLIRD